MPLRLGASVAAGPGSWAVGVTFPGAVGLMGLMDMVDDGAVRGPGPLMGPALVQPASSSAARPTGHGRGQAAAV